MVGSSCGRQPLAARLAGARLRRLVSKPVETVTTEIRKLADDMFETMYDAPGVGLAAIQIACRSG